MTINRILSLIGRIIFVGAIYVGIDRLSKVALVEANKNSELSYYFNDRFSFRVKGLKQKLLILLLSALLGLAIQISFSYLLSFILSFFEGAAEEYGRIIESLIVMEPGTIIYVGILAPIYEELTFRGASFSFLRLFFMLMMLCFAEEWDEKSTLEGKELYARQGKRQRLVLTFANILQAFFFAIYHDNIYQGGYAFVIGILFGELYILTDSVFPGMVAHSAVNLFGLYMDKIFPENLDHFIEPLIALAGLVIITEAMRKIRKIILSERAVD